MKQIFNKIKNSIKRKKEKGFTLIELLATIFIIGIVLVLVGYTVTTQIEKSREKAFKISKSNILSSAGSYVKEFYNNENWEDLTDDEASTDKKEKTCVSIAQLKAKGYLKNDVELKDKNDNAAYYVYYERNKDTKVITEKKLTFNDGSDNLDICIKMGENGKIPDPDPPSGEPTTPVGSCDTSGANKPELGGLTPIVYNETGKVWKKISDDNTSCNWYNYDEQKWANAASLTSSGKSKAVGEALDLNNDVLAMFVWIPRYSYTIGCRESDGNNCLGYKIDGADDLSGKTPGAIDIDFKNTSHTTYSDGIAKYTYSDTDGSTRTPSNWYTHPAFTFGDKELSGIWVGKFETSTDADSSCYMAKTSNCEVGSDDIRIIPNVASLAKQDVSHQFKYSRYLNGDFYGLDGDAHMMKNREWSAVAYLSQSKYGKYGNSDYKENDKEIFANNSSGDSDPYVNITGRSSGNDGANIYLIDGLTSLEGSFKYDVEYDGIGASTTGRIGGIYDMNGGAAEVVMAVNYKDTSYDGFESDWFENVDNKKYFESISDDFNFNIKNFETIGSAFFETQYTDDSGYTTMWYNDGVDSLDYRYRYWMTRGGGGNKKTTVKYTAGLFSYKFYGGYNNNNGITFRVVFAPA